MDGTNEKYPVCLNRNTRAALRRFFQPVNFFALLKTRRTPLPVARALAPVRAVSARARGRGAS
jgi:hypothetical protein